MKTLTYILTLAATLLFVCNAFAFDIPPKPENGWYVLDTAGKISQPDINILNQKIENFNKTTRNEIGVLIVPTLNGTSIEDAAKDTFHSWGIGKAGLDNGILIMIATNDRKMRIETGKGAEGDITDVRAMEILSDMKPYLRKNDYAGGITTAIADITKSMEDRTGQKSIVVPSKADNQTDDSSLMWVLLSLVIGGPLALFFVLWFIDRNEQKQREKTIARMNELSYRKHKNGIEPNWYPLVPPMKKVYPTAHTNPITTAAAPIVAAGVVATVIAVEVAEHKEREEKEERARKRQRDDDDSSSSSSSSSSSYDSSSSSGSDFGGGFGGGDSSGGGGSDSF